MASGGLLVTKQQVKLYTRNTAAQWTNTLTLAEWMICHFLFLEHVLCRLLYFDTMPLCPDIMPFYQHVHHMLR